MLRPGQILYTYLHLAPDPAQTAALVKSGAVCIAYETITGPGGGLPLLAPMSEVAGRMAVQAGAAHLEKSKGGMGILLGGVPGVPAAHVVVIGAGVVGTNALQMAVGLGARVTVFDRNIDRLRQLDKAGPRSFLGVGRDRVHVEPDDRAFLRHAVLDHVALAGLGGTVTAGIVSARGMP